jgi:hypothetical protein
MIPQHLFLGLVLKLAGVKIVVMAFGVHEFLMGSPLNDFTVMDDEDDVGAPNGGEAVGNDKTGSALKKVVNGVLEKHFHFRIH